MVQKLLNGDKKRLKAEVTAFKSCGAGSYQAVLELGFKMPDGSYKFSYFPFLLRIYRAVLHDGRIQFEDVTQVDLPETKLWAHYRVSTGSMGAAQNPDSLFSALVNGVQIHYVATDASKSDVFIPVEDSKLKLRFRTLLVNPSMGSIFWIHPDGKISLNQSTTEESDGPLSFGLMGGGKTGWSPWNHQFVGLVLGVEKGKLSQLENANSLLLPPHFGCAAK